VARPCRRKQEEDLAAARNGRSVPDFEEAYAAGRAGEKHELKPKATSNVGRGTLDDLRIRYCADMEVEVKTGAISALTLSGRQRALQQACDVKKGKHRLGALKADLPIEAFTCILDSYGTLTGAGEQALKALKAAYKWGASRGFPKASPVPQISTPHTGRGGATPWTPEDEKAFLERHRPGTMARLWFWLAKNMAGRIGDTFDIGPANIKMKKGRAYLGWQPKKKGSKYVKVPLMLELAEELERHQLHPDAFLVSEHCTPFASSGSLDNRVRKWIVAAGLTKKVKNKDGEVVDKATRSQHGIRKRTAHELAEAGATVYEIAARLSHSDFKSSAPYTRDVDRARLAESGFDRVQRARRRQGVPRPKNRGTPSAKVQQLQCSTEASGSP
jgi:integrase